MNDRLLCEIYFNLTKHIWSVRFNGRIVGHAQFLLVEPVEFHVGETGQFRIQKMGENKNVHAWVKGYVLEVDHKRPRSGVEITYNPHVAPFFHRTDNGHEVFAEDFKTLFMDFRNQKIYGRKS